MILRLRRKCPDGREGAAVGIETVEVVVVILRKLLVAGFCPLPSENVKLSVKQCGRREETGAYPSERHNLEAVRVGGVAYPKVVVKVKETVAAKTIEFSPFGIPGRSVVGVVVTLVRAFAAGPFALVGIEGRIGVAEKIVGKQVFTGKDCLIRRVRRRSAFRYAKRIQG